jgi:hypothetical protein
MKKGLFKLYTIAMMMGGIDMMSGIDIINRPQQGRMEKCSV